MRIMTAGLVVIAAAGSLLAHHSLGNYDTTTPVRVKGTISEFHQLNPHSIIYLEEKGTDGENHRWAVEGPAILQLLRSGFAKDGLKAGDVVEVCGYLPKETIMWQVANADPGKTSLAGRLINAETLVMPDGKQRSWGDYGFHKCFEAGFKDQHSTR
jgi:hypothetical protein